MCLYFLNCHRIAEMNFFRNHEVFNKCDPKLWGVDQLSKRLTSLLVNRIQLQLVSKNGNYYCIEFRYFVIHIMLIKCKFIPMMV